LVVVGAVVTEIPPAILLLLQPLVVLVEVLLMELAVRELELLDKVMLGEHMDQMLPEEGAAEQAAQVLMQMVSARAVLDFLTH
jgi:hypothetical protein